MAGWNIFADRRSGSETSPTTSPDLCWNPANSSPATPRIVKSPIITYTTSGTTVAARLCRGLYISGQPKVCGIKSRVGGEKGNRISVGR